MTKSITIRAADSAQAMEEVVRQLGPDALIMSSSRKNGQFEIVAMVEGEMAQEAPLAPPPAKEAPGIADRLKEALSASPFASGQQKEIAARQPAKAAKPTPKAAAAHKPEDVASDSPVGMTSPATFEALLKRRLEEDGVQADLSEDAAAVQAITERAAARRAEEAKKAEIEAAVEKALQAERSVETAPAAEAAPEVAPAAETPGKRPAFLSARGDDVKIQDTPKPTHAPASDRTPVAPVAAAPLPDDGLEYAPRVTGLGGFDIPTPVLPANVVSAIREDLAHLDRSGNLIGLTKAIVSSLLPERAVEPLGAGRFFIAGPDMRQKALAAVRVAIRKLDAGEAKPSFYVMGSEARADAAFLASKAELLGLTVMLVDETVGRNLPDNVPGSQIILLPDDPEKARDYAEKFQHDGDKGLFVLPSFYGRDLAANMLSIWSEMDVQILLSTTKYAPVSSGLLACLLQFNKQVAWTSDGEEVLDNLTQADEVIVSDWMRDWVPTENVDAADAPAAPATVAELLGGPALPVQ